MTDTLIDPVGPEGRNQEAAAFEDQFIATGETLGWGFVCRNVDLYVDKGLQSRGVDVLWAVRNPREDIVEGWISESKRKRDPSTFSGAVLRTDVLGLRKKVAKFDVDRFYNHEHIRRVGISRLVGGLVALSSDRFNEEKNYAALEEIELTHNEEGIHPTQILFVGPTTLNGLADGIRQLGAPDAFYWPPTPRHDGVWDRACPPQQLGAGLLAYKTTEKKIVLWVRDTLTHRDVEAYAEIVRGWGLSVDEAAFTGLSPESWRIVQGGWKNVSERLQAVAGPASLPERAVALHTSNESMKEYDTKWPRAVA